MSCDVILVDDHAALRNGIKSFFSENSDFKVALEAASESECQKILEQFESKSLNPEDFIAVVDISFKPEDKHIHHEEINGFEIIKKFSAAGVKCIAFSSYDSGGFIERSIELGAKGFVSKNAEEKVLLEALKSVAEGNTFIQPDLVQNLLEARSIMQTLTKKEKMVADALTLYKSNAEIGKEIGISEKTVRNYLSILYDKTGTENKVQLLEKLRKL